jgi:hypothetical protein
MFCEVFPGRHQVIRGDRVLVMLAGIGADEVARSIAVRTVAATSVDEIVPYLGAAAVDFVVAEVRMPSLRFVLRGNALAVRVVRADGTVAVFGAPADRGLGTVVENASVSVSAEILDPSGTFLGRGVRAPGERFAASRVVLGGAEPRRVSRAPHLRFSDGREVEVAGTLLLGRSPRAERLPSSELPKLVAVGESAAVSRTHARVRLEDGRMLLDDLGSRNGTAVLPPRGAPVLLRPGQSAELEDGAIVTIARRTAFRVVGAA